MSYVSKITDTSGNTGLVGSSLYGTCTTGASTAAKVAVIEGFDTLIEGVTVHIKFTNSNTATTPTLSIKSSSSATSGTTAKNIYKYGTTKPGTTAATSWYAGSVVSFTYDGSYWQMNDHIDDTNTQTVSSVNSKTGAVVLTAADVGASTTDEKVTQTATTTNADYEILFSGTADNTTRTEGARKDSGFTYNPSTKTITIGNRKENSTIGNWSTAIGYDITSSGAISFAEGDTTTASGTSAHAEGSATIASGDSSHSEGSATKSSGKYSHAEGYWTTAKHKSQHVFGEYNIIDPSTATGTARGNYVEIVGNGTSSSAKSNARTLDWSGNEWLAGGIDIGDASVQYGSSSQYYDNLTASLKLNDYYEIGVPIPRLELTSDLHYDNVVNERYTTIEPGNIKLKLPATESDTSTMSINSSDITLSNNSWDGTNGSLKSAISSLNSSKLTASSNKSNIKFYVDSVVVTPNGGTSYILYTSSQLNTKLGVSNVSAANTALFVMNGDYNAKTVYLLSCVQGNNWHVSDRNATSLGTTPMRVNVLIVYWG